MDNPIPAVPSDSTPDNEFDVVVTVGEDIAPTVPAYEHNNCEATIKRLTEERDNLIEENVKFRTEQIDGSDPRLANFWAKAQELADRANHCEVFDQIAEALGGPSRIKEFSVTVTMMVQVPVTYQMETEAKDEEEANEYALDYIRSMSTTDLEDYADWWNAEVDTYSMEAEAEEA